MIRPLFLLAMMTSVSPLVAGRFNKQLEIGDAAPAWTDLAGTDGQQHSLCDLKNAKAVLVVFTSNSCPYAMDAESRVMELSKKYAARGLVVVAINANKSEEDALPAMKVRAKEKQYPYAYLYDETQQTAKAFGARYTPEFYLLDGDRNVVYMGALDDNPIGNDVKQHYVVQAIEAVLRGDAIETAETAPVGCAIRYERIRRRK